MQPESDSTFLTIIYVVSTAFFIAALVVVILTAKIRKQVRVKHSRDMKILADWDSALDGLRSTHEVDIVVALDKIWVLSSPLTYTEIQPTVSLFVNHPSNNVSKRAQQILAKQTAWLSQLPTAEEATGAASKG
jgi:hypothetical protein